MGKGGELALGLMERAATVLIPGLIDSHVRLASSPGMGPGPDPLKEESGREC
jgi:hypothetical protein